MSPLGLVIFVGVVVRLPHAQRGSVADERDVPFLSGGEEAVVPAFERAALRQDHAAFLEEHLLVAGEIDLVHDPRPLHVLDDHLVGA